MYSSVLTQTERWGAADLTNNYPLEKGEALLRPNQYKVKALGIAKKTWQLDICRK